MFISSDKLLLKNQNIEVEDVACQIKNVLHNFDKDGINFLGEIDFDIDFDFNNYFNNIYALLDL